MLNVYEKIHKGQRAWIGRLLTALGTGEVAALEEIGELVAHLRAHAQHEDTFIHPLIEEAAAAIAADLHAQHELLDPVLLELAGTARSGDVKGTYRSLALFAAQYFRHIDVEEHQAMPALNSAFDDAALRERIFVPFGASRTLDDLVADLRLQLVALSPGEARELLAGVVSG